MAGPCFPLLLALLSHALSLISASDLIYNSTYTFCTILHALISIPPAWSTSTDWQSWCSNVETGTKPDFTSHAETAASRHFVVVLIVGVLGTLAFDKCFEKIVLQSVTSVVGVQVGVIVLFGFVWILAEGMHWHERSMNFWGDLKQSASRQKCSIWSLVCKNFEKASRATNRTIYKALAEPHYNRPPI